MARVKELAREGFFDGTPFHRVIEGFMAQGGDPTGSGSGGSGKPNLPAEFSKSAKFLRGHGGRGADGRSEQREQPVLHHVRPAPHLDGQYTIWGQVVSGMEFVDKIKRGSGGSGSVSGPDKILKARVASDAG